MASYGSRVASMKSAEFDGPLMNGQLAVPPEVARKVPAGETIHVVLLWNDESADDAWSHAGRKQFESAYVPEDAIYEKLIDDTSAR